MLNTVVFTILGLFFLNAQANDRIQKDQHIKSEFQKMHFFHKGRGMHLVPDVVQLYNTLKKIFPKHSLEQEELFRFPSPNDIITERWGFHYHPQKKEIVGLNQVEYKDMKVGVLGCIACHSGYAAGKFIIGLGNKRVDPGQVGKDLLRMQKLWRTTTIFKKKSAEYKKVEAGAFHFASKLSNQHINNLTSGLVPIAMIQEWFYDVAGEKIPNTANRGAVKVPMLWGYGPKRHAGQFCDGYGDGTLPGWGIAVELVGGQTAEGAREYMEKISHAEDLLENLLPPKYPFAINLQMAHKGKAIFEKTCAKCHGTYERDQNDLPIFKAPKHYAWQRVKTDRDRLDATTKTFDHLVETNPLNDFIKRTNLPKGYFAPRLEGIWSRFPYLHNASVPNMMALFDSPEKRPKVFSLLEIGSRERFDEDKLGLKVVQRSEREERKMLKKALRRRDIYSTQQIGQSNQGHYFPFMQKFSKEEKKQLIEYLKSI